MTTEEYNSILTPPTTSVEFNLKTSKYHDELVNAYNSITLNTAIQESVFKIEGMSGVYYRSFINNLIRNISDARYLEIGSWQGSTACSVISNNKCKITCIDNWSQFGGPKQQFLENISVHTNENINFTFLEQNFLNVNYSALGKFNVYLFDGPHTEVDQYNGICVALPALDDIYILIVDDWNWLAVRHGTHKAINKLNLNVLESVEIKTTQNNTQHGLCRQNSRWHNGYYIAVIDQSNKIL
jgi:hypothetical protein